MAELTSEEQIASFKKKNGIFFWKPYPWQDRALGVIAENNTTAVCASNKIGKCLTYQTLIDTPNGEVSIGKLFENGKPFDVYAWDGKKKVVAKAHSPFKKRGLHKCYRITMSDGRWIEAADLHQILMESGEYSSILDVLAEFDLTHQHSNLGASLSTPFSSDGNLSETQGDYRGDYSANFRQGDALPLVVRDTDLISAPSQADAQQPCEVLWREDDRVYKCTNTQKSKSCRPSSWHDLRQNVSQLFVWLSQVFYNISQRLLGASPLFPQPSNVATSEPRLNYETSLHQKSLILPYNPPLCIESNNIVSYNFIGVKSCYDFEVEEYHNYFAAGLINHNSAMGANIVISWALGYEPWQVVPETEYGAVKVGKKFYRKSSLGIKPPVDIIITGEDWKAHLGRVIVAELKKWAPEGWYTTKKNEQGVDYFWEWHNKSKFILMCYTQDDDLFESFRAQGAWEDEPPPKSKHIALSRGLLLDNGKTLLSLTPLKEAWILDDIVLSGRRDVGIVDKLMITDNPDLLKNDVAVLDSLGLNDNQKKIYFDLLLYDDADKKTPVIDQGQKAEKYLEKVSLLDRHQDISKLRMLKFIKDIDPSDVAPRVFGEFKSLVGRVLKDFNPSVHVIKPFDVPTDWPVTVMVDFHLSIPQAVTYFAINKQDIKYVIAETWKNGDADMIADDIIRKIKGYGWNIENAFIDPLSKGDTAYMRNSLGTDIKDTYSILDEKLSGYGVTLHVASKDKESGIKNLQTWLRGVNGLPTMYVFDNCERWLFEVQRWVFDDSGKPAKDGFDHMMENSYRYTLTGAKYEDRVIYQPPVNVNAATSWMGS